jgi:hypothetical protein
MVIYERNNKFLNFLTPALASYSGSPLLAVMQLLASILILTHRINLDKLGQSSMNISSDPSNAETGG